METVSQTKYLLLTVDSGMPIHVSPSSRGEGVFYYISVSKDLYGGQYFDLDTATSLETLINNNPEKTFFAPYYSKVRIVEAKIQIFL